MIAKLMIIGTGEEYCITSLQIADQTGKDHGDVLKTIRKMIEDLGLGLGKFSASYFNSQNKEQPMYVLPEREAMILASGYDVKLRAMIVDAFLKDEPKEVTTLEIIEMARDSELKRLETQAKLETQKVVNGMLVEKIGRKDNIILAVARLNIQVGDILLQEFAKNLNIKNLGRTNIFAWFKERGYLMKNTEPYSQYVKRGFFTRKPTEEKFGGKIRYTTMITPKGQTYFTQILRAEFEPEITPEEI